jgi:hypothetical protein
MKKKYLKKKITTRKKIMGGDGQVGTGENDICSICRERQNDHIPVFDCQDIRHHFCAICTILHVTQNLIRSRNLPELAPKCPFCRAIISTSQIPLEPFSMLVNNFMLISSNDVEIVATQRFMRNSLNPPVITRNAEIDRRDATALLAEYQLLQNDEENILNALAELRAENWRESPLREIGNLVSSSRARRETTIIIRNLVFSDYERFFNGRTSFVGRMFLVCGVLLTVFVSYAVAEDLNRTIEYSLTAEDVTNNLRRENGTILHEYILDPIAQYLNTIGQFNEEQREAYIQGILQNNVAMQLGGNPNIKENTFKFTIIINTNIPYSKKISKFIYNELKKDGFYSSNRPSKHIIKSKHNRTKRMSITQQ